jgi:hypothetical protein
MNIYVESQMSLDDSLCCIGQERRSSKGKRAPSEKKKGGSVLVAFSPATTVVQQLEDCAGRTVGISDGLVAA